MSCSFHGSFRSLNELQVIVYLEYKSLLEVCALNIPMFPILTRYLLLIHEELKGYLIMPSIMYFKFMIQTLFLLSITSFFFILLYGQCYKNVVFCLPDSHPSAHMKGKVLHCFPSLCSVFIYVYATNENFHRNFLSFFHSRVWETTGFDCNILL